MSGEPGRRRQILMIAPVFQRIYADSIRAFHAARDRRDVDGMLRALRMAYDAAPFEVKDRVNALVRKLVEDAVGGLSEPGWQRNAKVALHALHSAICSQLMSEYKEMEPMRVKREKCFRIMDNILQRVFTELIRAIDMHGGLIHVRWEIYGGEA